MRSFVWKDMVRVTVREITRGQQMDLWKIVRSSPDIPVDELLERVNEHTARAAVVRVELSDTDGWREVDGKVDIGDGYTLTVPLTGDALKELPVSLANGILRAALDENETVSTLINFTWRVVLNTASENESTLENEAS